MYLSKKGVSSGGNDMNEGTREKTKGSQGNQSSHHCSVSAVAASDNQSIKFYPESHFLKNSIIPC